jgi:hypothetical protein
MMHISEWHVFDPSDRSTYPKVSALVQVRFADGGLQEGGSRTFFPVTKVLPNSSITAWRHIQMRLEESKV